MVEILQRPLRRRILVGDRSGAGRSGVRLGAHNSAVLSVGLCRGVGEEELEERVDNLQRR